MMNRIMRCMALTAMLGALTACYEHTFTTGAGSPEGRVVYDHWHNHWLGGLIGENDVEIREICPSGNATIHDEQSFLNGLVSALTAGIYAPTTVKIRCADGSMGDIELDAEDVEMIVQDERFLLRIEQVAPERLDEVEAARATPQR